MSSYVDLDGLSKAFQTSLDWINDTQIYFLVNTQELGADDTTNLRIWTKGVTPLATECLSNAYVDRLTGGEHESIDQAAIDEVVRTNEKLATLHGLGVAATIFMCMLLCMFNCLFLVAFHTDHRARSKNEYDEARCRLNKTWPIIGLVVLSLQIAVTWVEVPYSQRQSEAIYAFNAELDHAITLGQEAQADEACFRDSLSQMVFNQYANLKQIDYEQESFDRFSKASWIFGFIWIAIVIVTMPTYRKLALEQLDLSEQECGYSTNADNAAQNEIVDEMRKEQEEALKSKIDVSDDPVLKELHNKVQELEEMERACGIEHDCTLVSLEDTASRQNFSSINASSNKVFPLQLKQSDSKPLNPQDKV